MQVRSTLIRSTSQPLALEALLAIQPHWVLVFGAVDYFKNAAFMQRLSQALAPATVLGCSTAGEITPDGLLEGGLTLTAVHFSHTPLVWASTEAVSMDDSEAAGQRLARQLSVDGLQAVIVFGPGVAFNGSALVRGLQSHLGLGVPISGGLAGDGGAFTQTFVLGHDGVSDRQVAAVGLCGPRVRVGHGSYGGWSSFGPARKVTRSVGNVLHELDGEPALTVYKRYLGEYAKDLPGSGLLFPFSMEGSAPGGQALIRTILGVSEDDGSLTLAGEIEEGGYLRLMQASTDRLVDGAETAAERAQHGQVDGRASLALLVSCVGRKLVMGDRVEDELEAVADVLGPQAVLTGFYSNGEISPMGEVGPCGLHNQTMTVTTLRED